MAFTSAKMGLRIWNLLTDLYDHAQLADNWAKVDYHDHSPGKGVQIPTEGLADSAVTGSKLAANIDPSGAYVSAKPIIRLSADFGGGLADQFLPLRHDYGTPSPTSWYAKLYPFYLDPNDWVASGRVLHYFIRAGVVTNAVAPTNSYTFALYPVATWGGASGALPLAATVGSAVTGSTTSTIAAPAAGGPTARVTSEFEAPSAGWYMLGVTLSGGPSAANANVALHIDMYAKQV